MGKGMFLKMKKEILLQGKGCIFTICVCSKLIFKVEGQQKAQQYMWASHYAKTVNPKTALFYFICDTSDLWVDTVGEPLFSNPR